MGRTKHLTPDSLIYCRYKGNPGDQWRRQIEHATSSESSPDDPDATAYLASRRLLHELWIQHVGQEDGTHVRAGDLRRFEFAAMELHGRRMWEHRGFTSAGLREWAKHETHRLTTQWIGMSVITAVRLLVHEDTRLPNQLYRLTDTVERDESLIAQAYIDELPVVIADSRGLDKLAAVRRMGRWSGTVRDADTGTDPWFDAVGRHYAWHTLFELDYKDQVFTGPDRFK